MDATRPDRRMAVAVSLAVVAMVGFTLVYAFSAQLGETTVLAVSDVGDVLAVSVCTGLSFLLWRAFDRRDLLKRMWLYLTLGLGLWTIGEAIYAFYELILNANTPYQSLADLLWIPGFVPIIWALWLRYRSLRVRATRAQISGLAAGFSLMVGLSLAFVIIPNLPEVPAGQLIDHYLRPTDPEIAGKALMMLGDMVLGVLYALGDLLLVAVLVLNIMALLGGQLSRSWMLVAVGCLITALADSLFYSGGAMGLYSNDVPINLFTAVSDISYFGGYVIVALGLYDQAILQRAV